MLTNFPQRELAPFFPHSSQNCWSDRVIREGSAVEAGLTCVSGVDPCAMPLSCLRLLYSHCPASRRMFRPAIHGTVFDPSNGRIPHASIVLVNNATGLRYERISDSGGRFAFELLPPGGYSARASADGMSPQLSPDLRVNVGGITEIDFNLTIAGPHESITVSAEAKLVENEPRGVSSVVDERAI